MKKFFLVGLMLLMNLTNSMLLPEFMVEGIEAVEGVECKIQDCLDSGKRIEKDFVDIYNMIREKFDFSVLS